MALTISFSPSDVLDDTTGETVDTVVRRVALAALETETRRMVTEGLRADERFARIVERAVRDATDEIAAKVPAQIRKALRDGVAASGADPA